MVVAAMWRDADRNTVLKRLGVFTVAALGISAVWVIRNLIEAGQPLGPRFEGGANEPLTSTIRLALSGIGRIVIGDGWSDSGWARLGGAALVALAVLAGLALRSGKDLTRDLGITAFAATSVVVPIIARLVTANDIELRVMSPILIPLIYFAGVTVDRMCTTRVIAVAGTVVLGWWVYQGAALAVRFPDLAPGGAGYKPQFSPQLYDLVTALPEHSTILTNNPQRVWWFTDREPILMGFTRPRAGNSHYPLDAEQTMQEACSGHAYLAWFHPVQNPTDGPAQRRPDLVDLVDLQLERSVPGGELYRLAPLDASTCRSDATDTTGQG